MVDVVLNGIRKSFGKVDVINGVDFTIEDREFAVFVGPSGASNVGAGELGSLSATVGPPVWTHS